MFDKDFALVLLLSLLVSACQTPEVGRAGRSFGPLYSEHALTLESGSQKEILGPLFSQQHGADYKQWSLSPLMSWWESPEKDSAEFDFLYPLVTYNRTGKEYRWHFLQLFSGSGGEDQASKQEKRVTLFPIFFSQKSEDPSRDYLAAGPFYGHLRNRLMRDEIEYVMFPLYSKTRRRDVVTKNYLFPFMHVRTGDGLEGWQLWPLIGHETKVPTPASESVPAKAGYDKWFAAWPFYRHERMGIGTDKMESMDSLLPLYVIQRTAQQDMTSIGFPFFYHRHVKSADYSERGMPWPWIVIGAGGGKSVQRYWPLYGSSTNAELKKQFFLWPLLQTKSIDTPDVQRRQNRWLIVGYQSSDEFHPKTGATRASRELWPLFTWRRDETGKERLQALALLEPILSASKSIERNYAPLYSIWRQETDPNRQVSSQSLLWNLYRRETEGDNRNVSLLFGLVQYKKTEERQSWKLFHLLRFSNQKK
ncbi:MAG: hypothetical protein EXS24_04275 [Pedosphaera sp.]|nr:hypothetical protein [Pedosphaera sp.]